MTVEGCLANMSVASDCTQEAILGRMHNCVSSNEGLTHHALLSMPPDYAQQ